MPTKLRPIQEVIADPTLSRGKNEETERDKTEAKQPQRPPPHEELPSQEQRSEQV